MKHAVTTTCLSLFLLAPTPFLMKGTSAPSRLVGGSSPSPVLTAKIVLRDGRTHIARLDGVGCSVAMCSRVAMKAKSADGSLVTTRLDGIAAIQETNAGQAVFALKDGIQQRLWLVRDFRVLYLVKADGGTEKLDLAQVRSVQFGEARPAGAVREAVRAALLPQNQRTAAPDFSLPDASGKRRKLHDYRGKALLVDFWATWCHGCEEEIPRFKEFARRYGSRGFTMLGVSLGEGGWIALKPFLAETKVTYPVLLGDERTAQRYGVQALPDTFLIDRQGRTAAVYRGLVDRRDVESDLRAVLAEP
jgi:peroxiredoxin